jgi:multidrug efflux pump subunit AcrA (membrane-fusion protein)
MKVDLTVDGTFVAQKTTEVPLRPDAWTEFEVKEAVDLGAKVRKGQVLMKFDDEKINEAIDDLELEQRLNELAIVRADEELPRMEKTLKMDFEEADRSNKEAKEDFERYNEIDRPMAVKSAEFMVKYYNFSLDYEKDELEQLEKMYEADDLTEETEEIVLKRQRNAVEFAEFSLENAKINTDEMLNIRLPRMDIQIKESLERAALALARAQMALSIDLNRARYEQQQRKNARTKSLDRHAKLLGDRELMEIESPAEGVVFYGQSVNGRWADTASLITKYKPHNNVSAGSILMTIVEPRPLYVTSQLDEGKRPEVSDGQKAKVSLPSEGSDRVAGKVKSISPIPVSAGKFEINFDVEQDEIPDWIVAGMGCKVQITTYDKKDALVVPKKAVHDDKDDPDTHYVWLVDPDDEEAKPKRREVKIGKRKEEDFEIVKGLKPGDVISLEDEDAKNKEEEEKKKE